MARVAPKVCVHCGRDCSGVPRRRGARGEYHCEACLERIGKAKRDGIVPGKGAAALPEDIAPIPLEKPLKVRKGGGEGGRAGSLVGRPCPLCAEPMATGAVVCVSCGYNLDTGHRTPTEHRDKLKERPGPKCKECGYSLRGILSPVCPECGTVNSDSDKRREYDRQVARATVRAEYLRPLLMIGIGLGLMMTILLLTEQDGASAIGWYMLGYAIHLPIGLVVFVLCAISWLGMDAPLGLTVLRLMGIYAVVDVVQEVGALAHMSLLGLIAGCFAYVYMLSEMMDIERVEAFVVGFITFGVKTGVWVLLMVYVFQTW